MVNLSAPARSQAGDLCDNAAAQSLSTSAAEDKLQRPLPDARPSVQACAACRQMKMKCEGAANPPCVRCCKAGRECLLFLPQNFQEYSRISAPNREGPFIPGAVTLIPPWSYNTLQHNTASSISFGTHPTLLNNYVSTRNKELQKRLAEPDAQIFNRVSVARETANSTRFPARQEDIGSNLPSIFWTSPTDAVNDHTFEKVRHQQHEPQTKRKRSDKQIQCQDSVSVFSDNTNPHQLYKEINIPQQDLRDMIQIFREKLLPHIPVLMTEDFLDADHLIEAELPLVYCACYVTARFLPGGRVTQKLLLPKVVQILDGKFISFTHQVNEISILKALIILYFYANCSSPLTHVSETSYQEEILYWPLKSLIEVYAFRLSLHKSIENLKTELQSNSDTPISNMTSYRRYTLWLQIFLMANCSSVVSGTPPSIPIDSTIRTAPLFMRKIGMSSQARLIGEIELCLIWDKAISQQQELGEWWCPPDSSNAVDEIAIESMLLEVDKTIDAWYDQWRNYINSGDGYAVVLDYLGRCARFNVTSNATRYLRKSSKELSSLQQDQVRRCVIYASSVLDWALSLRPIQRDRFRYVSESSSIMISFCCLFIIGSCQTFTSCIPNIFECLDKVTAAGRFIMELAWDAEHATQMHGSLVLRRAEALRAMLEQPRVDESGRKNPEKIVQPADLPRQDSMPQSFRFDLDMEAISAMEPFWDFPLLRHRPL